MGPWIDKPYFPWRGQRRASASQARQVGVRFSSSSSERATPADLSAACRRACLVGWLAGWLVGCCFAALHLIVGLG